MGYRLFLLKALPNDNILDLSKLKVLANDKRNANQKYKFGFNKDENSVRKYWLPNRKHLHKKKEMQLKNINLFLTRKKTVWVKE